MLPRDSDEKITLLRANILLNILTSEESDSIKHLAQVIGVSSATISIAVKRCREKGWIAQTKSKKVFLTQTGKRIASDLWERKSIIAAWLKSNGVPPDKAERDALVAAVEFAEESVEAFMRFS
jgi:Mn-dependent DtxR family transcriptional regulator